MKRLLVNLPDDLHQAIKEVAFEDGLSMSAVVRKLLGTLRGPIKTSIDTIERPTQTFINKAVAIKKNTGDFHPVPKPK